MAHRRVLFALLALTLAVAACGPGGGTAEPAGPEAPAAEAAEAAPSLLGGCILSAPAGEVPEDLYMVGDVVATDEYAPFTKKLTVCGLTLIGRDDISDDFMRMVARTVTEMFPRGEGIDTALQEELLSHLYRYRAVIPFFRGHDYEFSPEDQAAWDATTAKNSICDIIMEAVPGQQMEVVEHILHHVSDVGLHYTFPDEWGISRDSMLYKAMHESIDKGYYDIAQYGDIDEADVKDRVLLQEFAYWIITCAWNLQIPYGPEDAEWHVIRTDVQLEELLPLSHDLIQRTIPRVMTAPSMETLKQFDRFME